MTDKLPRIFLSPPHMSGREIEHVSAAFESNYIAPVGPQLDQFELLFKQMTGFQHCVAVSSGTAAIHLALRSLGIQTGDTVIASTFTFIGSVSPVTFLNAKPVFIDCDTATWNMCPKLLGDEIDRMVAAGCPPKAVIPTDLYGQSCDIDAIKAVCDPHQIPIVMDSAESLGATYKGAASGRGTQVAVFSFNGNKIITTSSGGMIASDDERLIEHSRKLSSQAREKEVHYEHTEIGYNYRLSNVLAGIGIGQLEVLEQRVQRRREIFQAYQERLGQCDGITFMPEAEYGTCNRWLTVATVDKERFGTSSRQIIQRLEQNNIEARPVWKPMHLQPVFSDCPIVGGQTSEGFFDSGICLPSGTALTESEIDRICSLVKTTGNGK